MSVNVLDNVGNRIGAFVSASAAVPAGTKQAVLAATMTVSEAHDVTNTVRLVIEADFGTGFRQMAASPEWTGGPNKTAPTLTWMYNPASPPLRVRGVLENVTQVPAGLTLTFS